MEGLPYLVVSSWASSRGQSDLSHGGGVSAGPQWGSDVLLGQGAEALQSSGSSFLGLTPSVGGDTLCYKDLGCLGCRVDRLRL